MNAPEGESLSQNNNHTFHLPNGYARVTVPSTSNKYHAIPGEEEEVAGADSDDGDDDTLVGVGVETSQSWHSMSTTQHALVRLAFGILGATVLLPFNALITPSEYYRSLLAGSSKESSFMSWFIAVYNVSCILFGAHATTSMPRTSVGLRIIFSEVIVFSVLLITSMLVLSSGKPSSLEPTSNVTFPLMIGLTLVLAAATSYLQVAVVTLANAYGPSCMGAMLSGQGFVGASISLLQLVAALSASAKSTESTMLEGESRAQKAAVEFYAANTVLMVFGMATFIYLQRTNLYSDMKMKMVGRKNGPANAIRQDSERRESNAEESGQVHLTSVSGINRYMGPETQHQYSQVLSAQKKVLLACISIAYIFIITLAIFPALTARVQSTGKTISPIVFVALHFFIFNLGDLIGRSLPSILPRLFLLRRIKIIALLCFLRTAFIPLIEYCNVSAATSTISPHSWVFGDAVFLLLMALLGISNGLLATSIFVIGPHQDQLTLPSEQGLAAGLLSWWLSFGLAIGSLSSFIVAPSP